MEENKTIVTQVVCFQMLEFDTAAKPKTVRNYIFLKNLITLEGAVSHNVLYYQQLSIARYRASFYANNSSVPYSVLIRDRDSVF